MPDSNHRKAVRTRLRADITLWHPEAGEVQLYTRDISDGGAYCVVSGRLSLAPGDIVDVQVQGLPGESAPVVAMRVIRVEDEGVALAFIDAPE